MNKIELYGFYNDDLMKPHQSDILSDIFIFILILMKWKNWKLKH